MGFFEDDRIRDKNHIANEAHTLFLFYKDQKWSTSDIAMMAVQELASNSSNRIMHELLKLATAMDQGST